MTTQKQNNGRGRPATIGTKAFIEVWNKSPDVATVVKTFKRLQGLDATKAAQYCSIRAFNLRAKGHDVKLMQRGRKAQVVIIASSQVAEIAAQSENVPQVIAQAEIVNPQV